jgi:hypothetical protein
MAKNIAPVPADGSAPMGAGAVVNASGAPSKNTMLMPKGHSKSVNPALSPAGPAYVFAPKERCGACYGIQVGFEAHTAPEAGMTQANGRLFQHAINRSAPNFLAGMYSTN